MNNKRHFTKPMMQQQMRINARLITFYHNEAYNEKQQAKACFLAHEENTSLNMLDDAYSHLHLVKVYKGYIRKLAEIQRVLKGCMKVRKGLSKAEADGRWPIVNPDNAIH